MCFRPAAVDTGKKCPKCGAENDFLVEACKECGEKFPAAPKFTAPPGAMSAPGQPGMPAAPGAPGMPSAPRPPGAPSAPKSPGL